MNDSPNQDFRKISKWGHANRIDINAVQKLTFTGVGINLVPSDSKSVQTLIKYPLLLYGILLSSFIHLVLIIHYAYEHITDFVEVTDSMPLLCQLLLCLLKMLIFIKKRQDISLLVTEIHKINLKAKHEEMHIVQRENDKDNLLCSTYLRLVLVTGSCGVLHPVIYGIYVYVTSGEIVFAEANKASYFWNHSSLLGYFPIYVLNFVSLYFACTLSLAFDSLFSWFVSNIVAQFHILSHRFEQLAMQRHKFIFKSYQKKFYKSIVSCIQYHRQTLYLSEKLNHVYGEIIFIKFLIVCSEICSLVYRLSRPNDSLAEVGYKILFLCAVALQLILYCWNGQKIKDKSIQVSTAIYCAFEWSSLSESYRKLLLICMLRSQTCSRVTGVFFEVDLSLYLWVFRTAGSFFTALRTMDEK